MARDNEIMNTLDVYVIFKSWVYTFLSTSIRFSFDYFPSLSLVLVLHCDRKSGIRFLDHLSAGMRHSRCNIFNQFFALITITYLGHRSINHTLIP